MSAYEKLEARAKQAADIDGALAMLGWDQRTMMPPGANEARGEQIATLAAMSHDIVTSSETGDLLAAAEDDIARLNPWQEANLRELRHAYDRAGVMDPTWVKAISIATSRAEMSWQQARKDADFNALQPSLDLVFQLVREQAVALGERFDLGPYDALLDGFETGVRRADIDPIFDHLADVLPDRIENAIAEQGDALPIEGTFSADRQKKLGERLMASLGFDFDNGRLDESTHPFCGGIADDVRITARYDEHEMTSGLMAILHETGHALYSAGLPKAWRGQPIGEARGMVVHESQSLLIEMQVCRSRPFLGYLAPMLQQTFGERDGLAADNLYRHATRVERGLIRVDADELTYPLHVILRYRLEKALLKGDLPLGDLPGAWNEGMRELLGVTPSDDALGCLQDIHWPGGAIGYFPCYTLGAVMAAQLFETAKGDDPSIADGIGNGEFHPLLAWLRSHVHSQGRRFDMQDLLHRITGKRLELGPYLTHLQARYGDRG